MTAVAAVMTAQAQERRDTTVIKNAEKVTIVTGDSLQRIVVEGVEGNRNYYYQNTIQLRDCEVVKKKERFDFDLGIGWSAPTNVPDGMSMAPFKSWECIVGVRYKYTPRRALQTYSVGLWCNWRRYTLSTDKMFEKGANSVVGLVDYPVNASDKHSDIHVFSLSVPLFFSQRFGRKCPWSVTIGSWRVIPAASGRTVPLSSARISGRARKCAWPTVIPWG